MNAGNLLGLFGVIVTAVLAVYGIIKRMNKVEIRQQDHTEIQAAKANERIAEDELERCRDQNLALRNSNAELTSALAEARRDRDYFKRRMEYWQRQVEGERS